MFCLIHAYENIFEGLHHMERWELVDCIDEKEAIGIAYNFSMDVIEDYDKITNSIKEELLEVMNEDDPDFEDYFEQYKEEDVTYNIWVLKDEYQDFDYDDIYAIFEDKVIDWGDPDGFIETYCNND